MPVILRSDHENVLLPVRCVGRTAGARMDEASIEAERGRQ